MLTTALTYIILAAALFVVYTYMTSPMSLSFMGKPKYKGLGYLAVFAVSLITIVLIECISAVLSLFGIKEDLAQEIYDHKKD
jgi:uncharacterized membrane protein (UPF0182 family)